MGGIAVDAQGRIYVADWLHRAIKRFTPDGQIDAIWQAKMPGGPNLNLVEQD